MECQSGFLAGIMEFKKLKIDSKLAVAEWQVDDGQMIESFPSGSKF